MIIKNKKLIDDDWIVLRLKEGDTPQDIAIPSGKLIVPLKVWLAQRDSLQGRADIGVWLASAERAEDLQNDAGKFSVIAVDFPKFADGRGYSIAHYLRARLNFHGELRAIGDVLRDQLFYMHRVGFNAFAVRADKDIHDALTALKDFTVTYQGSVAEPRPLFKRRRIPEAA